MTSLPAWMWSMRDSGCTPRCKNGSEATKHRTWLVAASLAVRLNGRRFTQSGGFGEGQALCPCLVSPLLFKIEGLPAQPTEGWCSTRKSHPLCMGSRLVRGLSEESVKIAAGFGFRVLRQRRTGHFQDRWRQVG